ncbi:SHOCT domain-containing protein [Flavonifractor plautii]|nr:SHOCT domain-containing protein [Flavonifractor plautii]
MINTKTELQFHIAMGILEQMREAGFLTAEEAAIVRRLAIEKYRPATVRE